MSRRTEWLFRASVSLMIGWLILAGSIASVQAGDVTGKVYQLTNFRGRLLDPETEAPMVGATLYFVETATEGGRWKAVTDEEGRFELTGLPFGTYVVEIKTANGERIYGVNALPMEEGGKGYEVQLRISDRIRSDTGMENSATRFAVWVKVEPRKKKRFWGEFAGFWTTALLGLAAF